MATVAFADRKFFTSRYPDLEVLDLSDLDDNDRMVLRSDKLDGNLIKATNRICAKVGVSTPQSIEEVAAFHPCFAEWCCDIARDYLDEGYDARETVQDAGEQAWKEIDDLVASGRIDLLLPHATGLIKPPIMSLTIV